MIDWGVDTLYEFYNEESLSGVGNWKKSYKLEKRLLLRGENGQNVNWSFLLRAWFLYK